MMTYLPQISTTSSRRIFMFIILSSAPARGAVFGSYNVGVNICVKSRNGAIVSCIDSVVRPTVRSVRSTLRLVNK